LGYKFCISIQTSGLRFQTTNDKEGSNLIIRFLSIPFPIIPNPINPIGFMIFNEFIYNKLQNKSFKRYLYVKTKEIVKDKEEKGEKNSPS
jgi:hypothetical protein